MCKKCDGLGLVFWVVETEERSPHGVSWGECIEEKYCDCPAGDWQREETEMALRVARELREQDEAVQRAMGFEPIPF